MGRWEGLRRYFYDLFSPDPFLPAVKELCREDEKALLANEHHLVGMLETGDKWFSGEPIRHNTVCGQSRAVEAATYMRNFLLGERPTYHACNVSVEGDTRTLHGEADVGGERLHYTLSDQVTP